MSYMSRRPAKLLACSMMAGLISFALPAFASELPGSGKTIRFVQDDSLGANYVQDQILISALEKLGYKVNLSTIGNTLFFQGAAQGDLDMTADVNFPQREPGYKAVEKQLAIVGDGSIIGGGVNGYLIDKKTADANHITNLSQLKDPKIAGLFGSDGVAQLISCDPGWSCGDVVDHQVSAFGLSKTVHAVRGKYEALMGETFARAKRGEPIFYYAWSPSWVNDALVPGKDVVWLPTPFDSLPDGVKSSTGLVKGVVGCAGGQDPCRMAMGSWNWRTIVNRDFIKDNPSVQKLAELAKWPIDTWTSWEGSINKDGSTDAEIRKLADAWISSNQSTFDGWVAEAMKAAK